MNPIEVLEQLSLDELLDVDKQFSNLINKARRRQSSIISSTLCIGDIVTIDKKYLGRGSKISSS